MREREMSNPETFKDLLSACEMDHAEQSPVVNMREYLNLLYQNGWDGIEPPKDFRFRFRSNAIAKAKGREKEKKTLQ